MYSLKDEVHELKQVSLPSLTYKLLSMWPNVALLMGCLQLISCNFSEWTLHRT